MSTTPFADFAAVCRGVRPEGFLVLGSGLSAIADRIAVVAALPFADISGLPSSSVAGHRGRLSVGRLARRAVLVAEGRLHYYEGHSWDIVVRPIQVAAELGVRWALLTNAAGGIRDDLGPGALMPLADQLEWNRPNPWREPRRPSPYAAALVEQLVAAGRASGLQLRPGVYAAVTGPSYETPAEIRALRTAGADAVGMSTTREALAGVAAGLRCAAVSLITNRAAGLSSAPLNHEEVLETGRRAGERLADVLEVAVRDLV